MSSYVVQAGLKPTNFLLQPSEYPDYRCILPHPPLTYSVDHTEYFKRASNEPGCSADQGLLSVRRCVSNISSKWLESCQQGEKVFPAHGPPRGSQGTFLGTELVSLHPIRSLDLTNSVLLFILTLWNSEQVSFFYSLRYTLWGCERPDLLHGMLSWTVLL